MKIHMFYYYIAIVLCVLGCLQNSLAQIPAVVLKFDNLLKMQQGLGWPHTLHVTQGHEALLTLGSNMENHQHCVVTTPSGATFEVRSPPSNRYESWSEGCGVRIRNVVPTDEGRWRLNATRDHEIIAGWTELYVQSATNNYPAPDILLQDGHTHTDVNLTTLDNTYCVVAQPFSESALVAGHCRVTLDRATRAVQGNWNVLLGIPGRVQELHLQRRVVVEAERLDVGFVHDTNTHKLHLYCNIQHTEKNITFCRFQKTTSASGYNVVDGLSDGTHSYYGEGFLERQCGMTIESPTVQDEGTWRCSVGVQMWVDEEHLAQQTPMQALISVSLSGTSQLRRDYVLKNDAEVQTVLVEEDKTFTVTCRSHVSLAYCWFQHPNGSQFTPFATADEDAMFWYAGDSLQTGDCGITFSHATKEEEGDWICHMGSRDERGVELTDRIHVLVTGPLAAMQKNVTAISGGNVTLYCLTANGNRPLEYCRFLAPNFLGFSIDSTITRENAILGRFYFTPGRNIDYGDCSLTINPVSEEDVGEWTCAALINEQAIESRDNIFIHVEEAPRSRAGIVGMAVSLPILLVASGVIGFLWYKKRSKPGTSPPAPPSQVDVVSLGDISNRRVSPASSISSDEHYSRSPPNSVRNN